MPVSKFWAWTVFCMGLGSYIPLAIGGWLHPVEVNVSAYGLWFILTFSLAYSMHREKHPGWRLPLGWVAGNAGMVLLGLYQGGYTFNLGAGETLVLYGLAFTLCLVTFLWVGTGKLHTRLLFWGSVVSDTLSYLPQLKQYWPVPHEMPTQWLIIGWECFFVTAITNTVFVDKTFQQLMTSPELYQGLYRKPKKIGEVLEQSFLALESWVLILFTISVMSRH